MDRKIDSQIFQVIDEMEDYLAGCKSRFMSQNDIIVDREAMEEFIRDLRRKAPDEIQRYRKIIKNQEEILEDARVKAQGLIDNAMAQTDELLSQHEIMRRAYEQADEVIRMANDQAQSIVDSAAGEANMLRNAATEYMEDVMNYLENIITASSSSASIQYNNLISTLNQYGDKIRSDHKQLHPDQYLEDDQPEEAPAEAPEEPQES
jgi:F0F1-type ATP synthase membrane subunit b/b'